jgi:hypothetical protein
VVADDEGKEVGERRGRWEVDGKLTVQCSTRGDTMRIEK